MKQKIKKEKINRKSFSDKRLEELYLSYVKANGFIRFTDWEIKFYNPTINSKTR